MARTVLDLARTPAAAPGTNPRHAMAAAMQRFGYTHQQPSPGESTAFVAVRFNASSAVFKVSMTTIFTGDITQLSMSTTVTHPKAVDPIGAFEEAVSLTFHHGDVGVASSCNAYLHLVSKKPTHGVRSGSDALGIAIALCRLFGCKTLSLCDGSTLYCSNSNHEWVSLRKARILTRGAGWYESKGFRSLIEALDPGKYTHTVGRLHTIPLPTLLGVLRQHDAVVRTALADRAVLASLAVAKYGNTHPEPTIVAPPSIKDIIAIAETVSVALEVLEKAIDNQRTLGDAVEALLHADCARGATLVSALLPSNKEYVTLVKGLDGRPITGMPLLPAWVHAWRLASSQCTMTLDLRRPPAKKGSAAAVAAAAAAGTDGGKQRKAAAVADPKTPSAPRRSAAASASHRRR